MSSAAIIASPNARVGREQMTERFPSKDRAIEAILNRAKDLWRCKIAVELARETGVSVRTAQNWLCGDRSIGAGALVSLLSGDNGFHFLEAMVESMPKAKQRRWRDEFDRAARRADLRARREALERELESEAK